jgi:hypothetical protein
MHEIHAPGLVRSAGLASRFTMNRHLTPTWPFGPQTKAFFAIEPVDNVLAHTPAFTLQHDMNPPVSEPDPCRHDLVHAVAKCCERIAFWRLALGGTMLACQLAGPSLGVAV